MLFSSDYPSETERVPTLVVFAVKRKLTFNSVHENYRGTKEKRKNCLKDSK